MDKEKTGVHMKQNNIQTALLHYAKRPRNTLAFTTQPTYPPCLYLYFICTLCENENAKSPNDNNSTRKTLLGHYYVQ